MHQNIIQGSIVMLRVSDARFRAVGLGIGINEQHPPSVQRERRGNIYGRSSLPYPAFLICHGDYQNKAPSERFVFFTEMATILKIPKIFKFFLGVVSAGRHIHYILYYQGVISSYFKRIKNRLLRLKTTYSVMYKKGLCIVVIQGLFRNPVFLIWIPAFAGMTVPGLLLSR